MRYADAELDTNQWSKLQNLDIQVQGCQQTTSKYVKWSQVACTCKHTCTWS